MGVRGHSQPSLRQPLLAAALFCGAVIGGGALLLRTGQKSEPAAPTVTRVAHVAKRVPVAKQQPRVAAVDPGPRPKPSDPRQGRLDYAVRLQQSQRRQGRDLVVVATGKRDDVLVIRWRKPHDGPRVALQRSRGFHNHARDLGFSRIEFRVRGKLVWKKKL